MRLGKIEEKFQGEVEVQWKSYALVLGRMESKPISAHSKASRAAAAREEPEAIFGPWDESKPYVSSSLPALEAAKCAELQDEKLAVKYRSAVFRGFFAESRDISDYKELIKIAEEIGLNVERFKEELQSGRQQPLVIAEQLELLAEYGSIASGVPFVVIGKGQPIVGAAPLELYSRLLERELEKASKPAS